MLSRTRIQAYAKCDGARLKQVAGHKPKFAFLARAIRNDSIPFQDGPA
jgi:hypothetical protein